MDRILRRPEERSIFYFGANKRFEKWVVFIIRAEIGLERGGFSNFKSCT